MADETEGSTVPRRQLGRLLTQLREEALVTLDATAAAMDCSRQKVWRIEKGMVPVRTPDLKVMCELYGVSGEMAAVVTGLAKETRAKGWWHSYGDSIPAWFSLYVSLETAASAFRYHASHLIPGLLQTREYATDVFLRNQPEMSEEELENAVALRLQRQSLLLRRLPPAPTLDVILSDAVLRRPAPDRTAIIGQLRHLLDAVELPNVSVRVLPLAAGPPLGAEAGSFILLNFPPPRGRNTAEPTTVYVEGLTGALYLDKPSEVAA
jgi:transcriptional regulator with XRE-family HTH domain